MRDEPYARGTTLVASPRADRSTMIGNGDPPAQPTNPCKDFNLLLLGVFHRTRLPGCTIPRLSKRRLAITSPIRHIVRICINIAEDLLLVKSSLTLP